MGLFFFHVVGVCQQSFPDPNRVWAGQSVTNKPTPSVHEPIQWLDGAPAFQSWEQQGSNIWVGGAAADTRSDPAFQIGLREDGVVVWRKRPGFH